MLKKGHLHIFGRKNQSLYDTNIKIKDMGLPGESDNTELVLGSAAIPESGTASVRARPTVKHHSSSSDSFQGFAVPTPKVPLLPPVNGPKINGSVSGGQLSNGSVLSVSELDEEDIFVPPHPSTAPPPPPGTFFIPPPDFMGDLSTLQAPSVPTTQAPYMKEDNFTALKPPPISPPKPPTTNGPASPGAIASPTSGKVPDRPKFAPPEPPTLQYKTPPPKPIRLSSISILDSPPQTPAPPPPVQTPTLSTFNPQNTAKLYDVPKTSILGGYQDRSTKPKQMLLLEDSASVKPAPVLAQVDGKVPQVPTPSKPISKDIQELKENLQIIKASPTPLPEPKEAKTVSVLPVVKPPRITQQPSPQLPKVNNPTLNLDSSKDKPDESYSQSRRFSPLLDRKLRNLKGSETNTTGHAASPLALLMAAKERDKHRTTHSLSRENSDKKDGQPSAIIQQSESSPNSFIVTPRSSSSSSLTSQETLQESPRSFSPVKNTQTIQTPEMPRSPALAKLRPSSPSLALSKLATSPSPTSQVVQKPNAEQSPLQVASIQNGDDKEELNLSFLPPPPEFDDFDGVMGPPPSMPPPDPPMKKAPAPSLNLIPKAPVPSPLPKPKPKPPAAPKLPPPDLDVKPKLPVQEKPKMVPNQLPSNLSPSQATLLSILQKKMLEMDHKMSPVNEAESASDDWGSPLSDEENKVPVIPKVPSQQSKSYPVVNSPVVNQAATVDLRELEGKMAKKHRESPSVKVPVSNGQQSKHQYGMTFTVRPGTKQPITLVRKGEP